MNVFYIPHRCELPYRDGYPNNTVMECEDCGQIWVAGGLSEWVRLRWYHFEARRHLAEKRTDDR